jgi:hypothetical protein
LRFTITGEIRGEKISDAAITQRKICSIEEVPMKCGFLLHFAMQCCVNKARMMCRSRMSSQLL